MEDLEEVSEHRRAYMREYVAMMREARRNRGECVQCGGTKAEGRSLCQRCLDRQNQNQRAYERRRRKQGGGQ